MRILRSSVQRYCIVRALLGPRTNPVEAHIQRHADELADTADEDPAARRCPYSPIDARSWPERFVQDASDVHGDLEDALECPINHHSDELRVVAPVDEHARNLSIESKAAEIGRASCRERVCLYV